MVMEPDEKPGGEEDPDEEGPFEPDNEEDEVPDYTVEELPDDFTEESLEGTDLSLKKERAARILWAGQQKGWNYKRIADEIGISTSTLYNWRQDPDFRRRMKEFYVNEANNLLGLVRAHQEMTLSKAVEQGEPTRHSVNTAKQVMSATGMGYRGDKDVEKKQDPIQVSTPERDEAPDPDEVEPDPDD